MRRVLVVGSGGAGKSHFSAQLAERTQLPLVHLDALYWRPDWVEPSRDEWDATLTDLLQRECWIMDGNYNRTLERRIAACDTVIFLDRSRWLCLYRVIKRRLTYRKTSRPDMTLGCNEQLSWSFLAWIFSYPQRGRPVVLKHLAQLRPHQRAVVLASSREIAEFLETVES
jgi:adenylate kinase family enzyme